MRRRVWGYTLGRLHAARGHAVKERDTRAFNTCIEDRTCNMPSVNNIRASQRGLRVGDPTCRLLNGSSCARALCEFPLLGWALRAPVIIVL